MCEAYLFHVSALCLSACPRGVIETQPLRVSGFGPFGLPLHSGEPSACPPTLPTPGQGTQLGKDQDCLARFLLPIPHSLGPLSRTTYRTCKAQEQNENARPLFKVKKFTIGPWSQPCSRGRAGAHCPHPAGSLSSLALRLTSLRPDPVLPEQTRRFRLVAARVRETPSDSWGMSPAQLVLAFASASTGDSRSPVFGFERWWSGRRPVEGGQRKWATAYTLRDSQGKPPLPPSRDPARNCAPCLVPWHHRTPLAVGQPGPSPRLPHRGAWPGPRRVPVAAI